ncbi:SDR family oxidoreductase [Streptomyces sp. NBC_00237]|uniref:SDR family NAD(P)-dependent oxidoreductase n=1 Tax=Streptomyces sp. NBC_00237 TaxID=2975687 RepID=UPI00225BE2B8|nr:SDR family oxidoreductase [Streptomyces sp. NBC_00237]MCX5205508.1 SDR family oxidoreductase [Streptomyces sp. NBC_00237]
MTHGMLAGKAVMITGASSGIGASAARLFASEGAAVLLMARREGALKQLAQEITAAGGRAAISAGDVAVPEDVQRAVDATRENFGALDAAFNNAGYAGEEFLPLHQLGDDTFDRTMDVNVRGTWNCLRSQIPVMLEAGKGAIVNTASTAAMVATGAPVPYVAAKHAVLGMTKAAAAEYANQGIRINALVVGTTRTEMIAQAVEARPEFEEAFVARQMQKRMADPVEIAQAALWLCSDLSSFSTGTALAVDGGLTSN